MAGAQRVRREEELAHKREPLALHHTIRFEKDDVDTARQGRTVEPHRVAPGLDFAVEQSHHLALECIIDDDADGAGRWQIKRSMASAAAGLG